MNLRKKKGAERKIKILFWLKNTYFLSNFSTFYLIYECYLCFSLSGQKKKNALCSVVGSQVREEADNSYSTFEKNIL